MVYEGDDCYIDLPGGTTLAARIIGRHGADVALMVDDPSPEIRARLIEATMGCMMLFADAQRRRQRGSVIYSGAGPMFIFRTSDLVVDGLQRIHSRAPLALDVVVASLNVEEVGIDGMFRTRTIDLSAGGVRIPRGERTVLDRCRMILTLPDETKVSVLGLLNRAGEDDLVYRFTMLSTQDRSRISTFVLSWHMDLMRRSTASV